MEECKPLMRGHRRRVYSLAAGPPGVIFAGDFSDAVKVHDLSALGKKAPALLPNAPVGSGAAAPIAGLQYRAVSSGGGGGSGGVAGLLFSTAAWFPPGGGDDNDDDEVQGCMQAGAYTRPLSSSP